LESNRAALGVRILKRGGNSFKKFLGLSKAQGKTNFPRPRVKKRCRSEVEQGEG